MPEPRRRYTFPASARLHAKADFDLAFREGVRASDGVLTVYLVRGCGPHARLGIAVGRRYGNAVQRNRIKRLLREAFRHLRPELPRGTDWVVAPRPGKHRTLEEVARSLRQLTGRLAARTAPTSQ
jgi:ribonuclease P protein component